MVHFFMAVKTENYRIFIFFTFGQGKNMLSNIWILLILLKEATTMVLELSERVASKWFSFILQQNWQFRSSFTIWLCSFKPLFYKSILNQSLVPATSLAR